MKNRLILSVSSLIALADFLMLSAGPLMLSADAIRKSASSLMVWVCEKLRRSHQKMKCWMLKSSRDGKVRILLMFLAHECSRKKRRSTNQHGLSDGSDRSDKSENPY